MKMEAYSFCGFNILIDEDCNLIVIEIFDCTFFTSFKELRQYIINNKPKESRLDFIMHPIGIKEMDEGFYRYLKQNIKIKINALEWYRKQGYKQPPGIT